MTCFLFFEGAICLAAVLALAGFVTWWAVVVLPLSVAAMVKLNDVVAGQLNVDRHGSTD
jgi:predicted secreted protein